MTKKRYVEGNIVVKTPYFKMPEGGGYFLEMPEGAKIMPTNLSRDGSNFLVIDDKNPRSIFNEYYAQGEFSSYFMGAEYLYKSFSDVYSDYVERKDSFKMLLNISSISEIEEAILNRMIYLSLVASFETFISDIIVTEITSSKHAINECFKRIRLHKKSELEKPNINDPKYDHKIAIWEQGVIEKIMNKTYSNVNTIIDSFKVLFDKEFKDNDNQLHLIFQNRHLLAHKNGRDRDDNYFTPTKGDIEKLTVDLDEYVNQVMDIVCN